MTSPIYSSTDGMQPGELCPNNYTRFLWFKPRQLKHDLELVDEGWGYKEIRCSKCGAEQTLFQMP
jgi:hypothetical protein